MIDVRGTFCKRVAATLLGDHMKHDWTIHLVDIGEMALQSLKIVAVNRSVIAKAQLFKKDAGPSQDQAVHFLDLLQELQQSGTDQWNLADECFQCGFQMNVAP